MFELKNSPISNHNPGLHLSNNSFILQVGLTVLNTKFTCKAFRDRGGGVEESIYGADFSASIRFDNTTLKKNKQIKSVLVQAKKPENNSQKEIMDSFWNMRDIALAWNDSFLAVYEESGPKISSWNDIRTAGFNHKNLKGEA